MDINIPNKDAYESSYEDDNHKLHFDFEQRPNENSQILLDNILSRIVSDLRESEIRPSIAFTQCRINSCLSRI